MKALLQFLLDTFAVTAAFVFVLKDLTLLLAEIIAVTAAIKNLLQTITDFFK